MRKSRDCRQAKASLVVKAMAEPKGIGAGPDVLAHLSACTQCRLFAEGISAARQLFDYRPLYSEALRLSTLRAVINRQDARVQPLFLWLVPCSVMGLLVGLIGPFVLLSRLIQLFIDFPLMGGLIFVAVLSTIAVFATGVGLTLVIRNRRNGVVAANLWRIAREV